MMLMKAGLNRLIDLGSEDRQILYILTMALVVLSVGFLGSEVYIFLFLENYSLPMTLFTLLFLLITLFVSTLVRKANNISLLQFSLPLLYILFWTAFFFFKDNKSLSILGLTFLPVLSVLTLGVRRSVIIFLCGLLFLICELLFFGNPIGPESLGIYIAVSVASYIIARVHFGTIEKNSKAKDELDQLKEGFHQVTEPDSDVMLKELISYMSDKQGDMFILYRKDVLRTLQKIPQPHAVLSYLMLEGLGDVKLFQGDKKDLEYSDLKDMGNYFFTSTSVDDYFSRVEAVLDFRNAKKSLEFNKIQNQINRVFSGNDEIEKEEPGLNALFEQYNITDREVDIATCILKGLTNKEISQELYISYETVKSHVKNILKKCGISSRIELIKLFSK